MSSPGIGARNVQKLYLVGQKHRVTAIKRSAFESVLMRWMNLGSNIKSEVSQKDKDKYHILKHIYEI